MVGLKAMYNFKPKPETVRAIGLVILTYLAQLGVAFDPVQLAAQPRVYIVSAVVGLIHVVATKVLDMISHAN